MYKIFTNTLFLGKEVVYLPSCHSTNDIASDLLAQNRPEGALVITSRQTAGRGQRGNQWETQPGENLTFSLLFRPQFLTVSEAFGLNLFVSLALRDWAASYPVSPVEVKWPNDLYVEGRKMGGVLIENTLKGKNIQASIIGIGLNINQLAFGELRATSLRLLTGEVYELRAALENLLACLEKRYLQLKRQDWQGLWADYHQYLFGRNETRQFQTDREVISGKIVRVNKRGELELQMADGALKAFAHGTLQWIFQDLH
ncbi:MAG: biotin--[acetyl-CoA-carboxylase] ligase [Bacteroidota bacterium]